MWVIKEHRTRATKVIDKAPKQVQNKYTFWKQLVQSDGPKAVRAIKGFNDHALKEKWEGCRSSYLNDQYRVIYAVVRHEVTVYVEKIGPQDY